MRRTGPNLIVTGLLCCLAFAGCIYDVPITDAPTRKVDPRLLGDWVSADGKDKFVVRQLDSSSYIVDNNGDLFRAYHSDVGAMAFVSLQHLGLNDRKYAFVTWQLSGRRKLVLRALKTGVVPEKMKSSAEVRALLEKNRLNPELLGEELSLTKVR